MGDGGGWLRTSRLDGLPKGPASGWDDAGRAEPVLGGPARALLSRTPVSAMVVAPPARCAVKSGGRRAAGGARLRAAEAAERQRMESWNKWERTRIKKKSCMLALNHI